LYAPFPSFSYQDVLEWAISGPDQMIRSTGSFDPFCRGNRH